MNDQPTETHRILADGIFGRCHCPDDSGSCDWCQVYYGHALPAGVEGPNEGEGHLRNGRWKLWWQFKGMILSTVEMSEMHAEMDWAYETMVRSGPAEMENEIMGGTDEGIAWPDQEAARAGHAATVEKIKAWYRERRCEQ